MGEFIAVCFLLANVVFAVASYYDGAYRAAIACNFVAGQITNMLVTRLLQKNS